MLIGIVVPAFNCRETISRAVESVIKLRKRSRCHSFYLSIIDDCSSDGTSLLLESQDLRNAIDYYKYSAENRGVSYSRNVGIVSCRHTDYICFLDSDDELLDITFDGIDFSGSPDLVVTPYSVNSDAPVEFLQTPHPSMEISPRCLSDYLQLYAKSPNTQGLFTTAWSKLYKTAIFFSKGVRFDEKMRVCEDTKFVFDFLVESKFVSYQKTAFYLHHIERVPAKRGTFAFSGKTIETISFVRAIRSFRVLVTRRLYDLPINSRNYLLELYANYAIIYMIRSGVLVGGIVDLISLYAFWRRFLKIKIILFAFAC